MSQEHNSPQFSQVDYTTLKQQFSDMLLAPDSPVANEAAFKRDRESYFDLLEQRKKTQEQITLLKSETKNVSEAENAAKEAESQLQVKRKQLLELATTLGKTAFKGLQSGDIADDLRFNPRKELESRIEALRRQKDSVTSENPAGVLEQTALKAKQLKLTGQIKAEEFRIKTVNQELGKALLSAKAEETVRCSETEKVLEKINRLRERIAKAKDKHQKSELNYKNTQERAAEQLGVDSVSTAISLQAELKQKESELRSIEIQIEDLQDEVAVKALDYEWLRDNPALKEILERLTQLKKESTPRKISVWPLAAVVITGHLFASFGSEPLNLSHFGILVLYLATGLGGLGLLAYYKPDLVAGERRYKSLLLLFSYSIISVICILLFQELAEYALNNWSDRQKWARGRLILFDLPRIFLVAVGTAYQDTFSIMQGTGVPESFSVYFRNHMLSIGLCEELIKLSPALIAFAAHTGSWRSRSQEFNSRLVYLAMIGGLAFGLGEAVYYHFTMYAPMQVGWGLYAIRFLSLVTIHAVWAGISGWILAHVTGGWIRSAFTTAAHGWGPVGGCLLIAATVGVSDVLHTSHNLSNDPLWMLTWDVISLVIFAWLIRCSNVSQLVPDQARRLWRRGFSTAEIAAVAASMKNRVVEDIDNSPQANTVTQTTTEVSEATPNASSEPELWNPNAAGFWSLLLTPIFGAWLHAKNWTNLNETERSKKSFKWVYGSIGVVVLTLILPDLISNLAFGALLVAWWMKSGNEQYKYVKENHPDYQKKKWGTPLSIAGLTVIGVFILFGALELDRIESQKEEILVGQWAEEFVANADELSITSAETGHQLSRMSMKGVAIYSNDRKSRHEFEWLRSGKAADGSRFRYILQITLIGQWSFDGENLTEYVDKLKIIPADNATKIAFERSSKGLENLKKLYTDRPFSYAVNIISSDQLEFVDQDTGIIKQLRRLHGE
ncbi:PrsW family intramembrane metalloprotease [Gimesia benthica]|uniref:PrsW family intramembrane metalloprotease n=1 Tax=Gimesia benthica TaxID=2608982 RepID=A0A6I6A9C8_9PLAN|nr:PrsW family glutamic-type intramembrane protease [Gimesia benthica]QGQ21975.1 PrsW family intramembrane metalloprotease [Gimesia benthica]